MPELVFYQLGGISAKENFSIIEGAALEDAEGAVELIWNGPVGDGASVSRYCLQDARQVKDPVIAAQSTPGKQIPAPLVIDQPERFYDPRRFLHLQGLVGNLQLVLLDDCLDDNLKYCWIRVFDLDPLTLDIFGDEAAPPGEHADELIFKLPDLGKTAEPGLFRQPVEDSEQENDPGGICKGQVKRVVRVEKAVSGRVELQRRQQPVAQVGDVALGGGEGNFKLPHQGAGVGKAVALQFIMEEIDALQEAHVKRLAGLASMLDRRYFHLLPVFGDGAAGNLDIGVGELGGDGIVTERFALVFVLDHLADTGLDRL